MESETRDSVAVLLATYNGEGYLQEQLDSLLNQTYKEFVCYIHDDGSSDGTQSIVTEYEEKYPGKIVIVDGPSCGGARSNFLYLLRNVKSDYYLFCDQDDVWDKMKLEKLVACIKEREQKGKPCAVFTDLVVVDEKMQKIADSYFSYSGKDPKRLKYKQILIQNYIPGCTMIFNSEAADIANKYQNIENIYMHDWWVALIASLLGDISSYDEPLVFYRQHGDNTIGADKKVSLGDVIAHTVETIFGSRKKQIKERIYRPRRLAAELCALDGVEEEDRRFLQEFSRIGERNKIYRVRYYIKNQLFRNNHRNWLMLMFV